MSGTQSESNDNLRWLKNTKPKTNYTDAILEVSIFNLFNYSFNVLIILTMLDLFIWYILICSII